MRILKIITLFVFAFVGIASYGQSSDMGILLGLSGAQVTGAELTATGFGGYNKLGLDAGIYLKQALDENWSIEEELKYIQKGHASISSDPSNSWRLNYQYIEIPVYFARTISKDFKAELGLAGAYLLNANTYNFAHGSQSLDEKPGNYDISAVVGISYLYSEKLSFNLKLSYSIIPIDYTASYITWQGNLGRYNNVLELAAYYSIN